MPEYDGYLNLTTVRNETERPEPVLTADQYAELQARIDFLEEELRRRDEE